MLRAAELRSMHTAAGPSVHVSVQELDPPRVGQTLRRVLLGSRVQLRTCQSGIQHIGAPTVAALIRAHSSTERRQPATSSCWRFIDWNELEQRELLTEAKRLLETGELFSRGTAEEPHAPDAEAEVTDSKPEAHVLEPLADDTAATARTRPLVSRNQRHQGHQRLLLLQREQP